MITLANDVVFPSVQGTMDGLTIRQYFAAMALQGILAADNCSIECSVETAVCTADLLIYELNNTMGNT
jgi:hypothetical protein